MYKPSLSKEYNITFVIIIFISIIFALGSTIYSYKNYKLELSNQYAETSNRVSSSLTKDFDYIYNLSKFVGNIIVNHNNPNDLVFINTILKNKFSSSVREQDFFLWSLFGWTNTKDEVVVTNKEGILKFPSALVSRRTYPIKARLEPWQIHFDKPTIGNLSHEYVIPLGMGISDHDNKYIGLITTGLNISQLKKNIGKIEGSLEYMVLTADYQSIFGSLDGSINANIFKVLAQDTTLSSGYLIAPINYNQIIYKYYYKTPSYPFIILLGENSFLTKQKIKKLLYSKILDNMMLSIFFCILLYFFRHYIITPMVRLSKVASEISKGNIDFEIPKVNTIEAQALCNGLEKVKELISTELALKKQEIKLKQAAEDANFQIKLLNESLEQKVIERTFELEKANKKIKQINNSLEYKVIERTSELQKALAAKTEFLNNMSHEIRTPVQGIIGISQGLFDNWEACKNEERKFYAQKIAESGNRLFSLVSNLLDLAECNAGSMQFYMEEEDLIELTQAMIEESKDLYIRDKEIELQFETSLSSAKLICDHERILQVLRNIFANAIKFTAKGKIIARLEECVLTYDNGLKQEGYHFSLSDEGIGIPEGEEASIFDPFTQSTRTKTRAGGTGLGLAICRDIIDAHNGRIWASNNETVGTTIYFEIPQKFSNAHSVLQLKT